MTIAPASVQQSIQVQLVDDAGLELTGKLAAFFPTVSYQKAGANAAVPITLSDLATVTTAWTSGGVKEISSGTYRLDLPDAAMTTTTRLTIIGGSAGKHVIAPPIDVQYTQTSVHDLGLEAQTDAWLSQSLNGGITTVVTPQQFGFNIASGVDPNQTSFDNHGVYVRPVTGTETRTLYAVISGGKLNFTENASYGIGDEVELIPALNLGQVTAGTGTGDTDVDHNTLDVNGDNLIVEEMGEGLGNATVDAYLKSEFDADQSAAVLRGRTSTRDDGTWVDSLRLFSGLTYYVKAYRQGDTEKMTKTVLVS